MRGVDDGEIDYVIEKKGIRIISNCLEALLGAT